LTGVGLQQPDAGHISRYVGDKPSGQASALANFGKLLFFAYFAEAPLIVPADATRAMLSARSYKVRSAAG
jgi:hypothetical protein